MEQVEHFCKGEIQMVGSEVYDNEELVVSGCLREKRFQRGIRKQKDFSEGSAIGNGNV